VRVCACVCVCEKSTNYFDEENKCYNYFELQECYTDVRENLSETPLPLPLALVYTNAYDAALCVMVRKVLASCCVHR
jgi:hypothetical protein